MKFVIAVVLPFSWLLIGLSQTKSASALSVRAQNAAQASSTAELAEADQLNAQVVELYKEGKFDKALPLARRVTEIRERVLGANHPNVATSLSNVATILAAKGKYDEAGQILQRVVTIKEKTLGEMHADVGRTLEQYACLLWGRGKRDEAKKIEKRVGEILHNLKDESEFDDLVKGKAISLPQPRYPEEARRARIVGTVVVWVVIDETGKVVQSSGRCADPLLVKASVAASYMARFKPTLVSGKPYRVTGYLTYNFVPR